jgi:hypothetical protein
MVGRDSTLNYKNNVPGAGIEPARAKPTGF